MFSSISFLGQISMWFFILCHVRPFATPWTTAHYASLSFIIFRCLLKLMSIKLVMPSRSLCFQISMYRHNSFSFLWLQTLNPIYSLIWLFKLTNEMSFGFSSPLSTSKLQTCYKVSLSVHTLPLKTMSFLCLYCLSLGSYWQLSEVLPKSTPGFNWPLVYSGNTIYFN